MVTVSRRSRQTHEEHVRRAHELELLAQEGEPAPTTGPHDGGEERERSVAAGEASQEERRAREREHGHDQPWVPTSGLVDRAARRNPRRQ